MSQNDELKAYALGFKQPKQTGESAQHICPNCGHCPTCGRGYPYHPPIYPSPYPVHPYYPTPYIYSVGRWESPYTYTVSNSIG